MGLINLQRLQLDSDEKLTRKEYLKRKKKQNNKIKVKNKGPILFGIVILLLSIYVFTQFYVYSKANNYKYVSGEDVDKQKIYNVYYVTEGYTYDPVYSLNLILSNGFNDSIYYSNSLLTDINLDKEYVYGIKNEGIYRIKKDTKEMETVIEKDVSKYLVHNNIIYYTTVNDAKLCIYSLDEKKNTVTDITNITEILVDDNSLYIVQEQGTKKILIKCDKNGNNKSDLKTDINVSYLIQDESNLYFVNKSDGNKIYSIGKDGQNYSKVEDIVSISDTGNIKEIDGSKYMFVSNGKLYYVNANENNSLYSIDLQSKEKVKIISSNVEILQNVNDTVFYKVKGEMGVYLFNVNTNFSSQITSRKLKEFIVDPYVEIDINDLELKKIKV